MVDSLTKAERSALMSRVKGKNTFPELEVRRLLHRLGYRFRLHVRSLPGRPDVVLPRHHKIVQVHGCFWHRHPGCRMSSTPKSRVRFWTRKFSENVSRDQATMTALAAKGWKVLVVWECQVSRSDL